MNINEQNQPKTEKTREVSIITHFFPREVKAPYNSGFVSIWKSGREKRISPKLYSFTTQTSLNRLAKVLRITTTVTPKPDNIKVAGAYFAHDSHVTEVVVTGKLR